MRIYTRVKGWDGEIFSIPFKNGVGETDDAYLIQKFRDLGWQVEDVSPPKEEQKRKGRKKR